MKTLAILREHDIHIGRDPVDDSSYVYTRSAVRAFLFDESENVAALYYPPRGERVYGEYLLVGGGVEEGESLEDALMREAQEEAGCDIHQIEEIGHVKQYGIGTETKRIQDEYFYKAYVRGDKGQTNFDEREISETVELHWVTLEKLIETLENQRPSFSKANTLIAFKELFGK